MNPSSSWQNRPRDIFNLYNPAFCGEIIRRCIHQYELEQAKAFPFPLIFLILPMILDKFIREKMPDRLPRRTFFLSWLSKHPEVRIDFGRKARCMKIFTTEAFLFLLTKQSIKVSATGKLNTINYRPINLEGIGTEEIKECYKSAQFLGKWFSEFKNPELIFVALGIRP